MRKCLSSFVAGKVPLVGCLSQLEGGDGAGLRPAFELCLLCKGNPHLPRDTGIGYPRLAD